MRTTQASIAFILFILLALFWFLTKPVQRAATLTLLTGTLFLPEATNLMLPPLPHLGKGLVTAGLIAILNLVLQKKLFAKLKFGKGMALFMTVMLLSNIPRVLTNQDTVVSSSTILKPIVTHTIVTYVLTDLFGCVLIVMVGMAIARRREWVVAFLKTWFAFTLVYCLFALWEIRFSPQLHTNVYGYFQHSFDQMIRSGGYRPIVFMAHGLAVGLFFCLSAILSFGALSERIKAFGLGGKIMTALFAVMLLISKCIAALAYFLAAAGILAARSVKLQGRFCLFIGALVLTMPAMRALELFPWQALVDISTEYAGAERSESLAFRFQNEEDVIQRTLKRPLFGSGGYGRGFRFNHFGDAITTVDSEWIIVFMDRGFVGYFGVFGLLAWPLFRISNGIKRATNPRDARLVAGLGLAVAIAALDLMVNGQFNNLAFLLAGLSFGVTSSDWLANPEAGGSLRPGPSRRPVASQQVAQPAQLSQRQA